MGTLLDMHGISHEDPRPTLARFWLLSFFGHVLRGLKEDLLQEEELMKTYLYEMIMAVGTVLW